MAEDTFGVIGSAFVEAVHVELPYEWVHFAVSEVAREDYGLEFVDIFDDELGSGGSPIGNLWKLLILRWGTL